MIVSVLSACTVPMQVITLLASTEQTKLPVVPPKLYPPGFGGNTPIGNGSRTTTPVASLMPLLPTTKTYSNLSAARIVEGSAAVGSGMLAFVIVRSYCGLIVVI